MALCSSVISSKHDKLVWTLNFYVIEMTSKFAVDSDELIVDSIISANNILKRTGDYTLFHLIVNVSISNFCIFPHFHSTEQFLRTSSNLNLNQLFIASCVRHWSSPFSDIAQKFSFPAHIFFFFSHSTPAISSGTWTTCHPQPKQQNVPWEGWKIVCGSNENREQAVLHRRVEAARDVFVHWLNGAAGKHGKVEWNRARWTGNAHAVNRENWNSLRTNSHSDRGRGGYVWSCVGSNPSWSAAAQRDIDKSHQGTAHHESIELCLHRINHSSGVYRFCHLFTLLITYPISNVKFSTLTPTGLPRCNRLIVSHTSARVPDLLTLQFPVLSE